MGGRARLPPDDAGGRRHGQHDEHGHGDRQPAAGLRIAATVLERPENRFSKDWGVSKP